MSASGVVEDIVVDLTLEVDPAIGTDRLARDLVLPGVEILRTSSATTVWLTVLVAAESEASAVREVRETVISQIPQAARVVQATVVTSAPLGDLHARIDSASDDALDRVTLRDLVETHLWNQRGPGADLLRRDTPDERRRTA